MSRRRSLTLLSLLLAVRTAGAQRVRGVVVDGASQPVPGVAVMLVDETTSRVAGRALSTDSGTFRLGPVTPGAYHLSTLRIGYAPTNGPSFAVPASGETTQRIVVSGVQIRLDTVRVVGRGVCGTQRDSAAATFAVWDQARAALTATQLTGGGRALVANTVRYERELDEDERTVRGQSVLVRVDSASEPWRSLSPDALHRAGYVTTVPGDSTIFTAPDIETLLSEVFAEDHCFRLQASPDATRVGIAFEPIPARDRIAEVRGTLWLDRRTSELREMEYAYANLRPAIVAEIAGGSMQFARAGNAGWIISGWSIRMPVLTASSTGFESRRVGVAAPEPRLTGVHVSGGKSASIQAGKDTIWKHPPVSLMVIVVDSVTKAPIANADVSLDESRVDALTDSSGRAILANLRIGNQTLRVHTPALDALLVSSQMRISVLDSTTTLTVRLPNPRRIAERGGTLSGSVVSGEKRTPVIAAEVIVPDLGMATRTDGQGNFRLEHVPAGSRDVMVRRIGYQPLEAKVSLHANRDVKRIFSLDEVVVLDSVVVVDRGVAMQMQGFEDRRRRPFGHFFTRDSIARYDNLSVSNILEQINGIALLRSPNAGAAYVASLRRPPRLEGTNGASPPPGPCFAHVYLDHLLVYKGSHSGDPPFDINSISPSQIEGIEFYSGPSETPAEFQNLDSDCGVLVIWTRRTP